MGNTNSKKKGGAKINPKSPSSSPPEKTSHGQAHLNILPWILGILGVLLVVGIILFLVQYFTNMANCSKKNGGPLKTILCDGVDNAEKIVDCILKGEEFQPCTKEKTTNCCPKGVTDAIKDTLIGAGVLAGIIGFMYRGKITKFWKDLIAKLRKSGWESWAKKLKKDVKNYDTLDRMFDENGNIKDSETYDKYYEQLEQGYKDAIKRMENLNQRFKEAGIKEGDFIPIKGVDGKTKYMKFDTTSMKNWRDTLTINETNHKMDMKDLEATDPLRARKAITQRKKRIAEMQDKMIEDYKELKEKIDNGDIKKEDIDDNEADMTDMFNHTEIEVG